MSNTVHLRKYGVSTTVNFALFEVDGVDFRVDAVHASGDSSLMKDEGTEANTTNSFTDEGTGYSIVLTATELQAARLVIYLVDQTATKVWLDTKVIIETYGNASAQHAFDLDIASVAQTGDSFSRIGAPAGASIAADLADIPTVSELTARTLLAAAYFDPAADAVANVTNVGTTAVNTDSAISLASIIATLGVAGLGLSNLGGMSTAMKAEIEAEVDDSIAGLNDITVAEIITTAMTESYAADGATNTLAQILYMILANITEFSNSGVTRTTKRLDGSTTAGTFTYDSASLPTEITRTT